MRYVLIGLVLLGWKSKAEPAPSASWTDLTQCYSRCIGGPADCAAACDAKGSPEVRSVSLAVLKCLEGLVMTGPKPSWREVTAWSWMLRRAG